MKTCYSRTNSGPYIAANTVHARNYTLAYTPYTSLYTIHRPVHHTPAYIPYTSLYTIHQPVHHTPACTPYTSLYTIHHTLAYTPYTSLYTIPHTSAYTSYLKKPAHTRRILKVLSYMYLLLILRSAHGLCCEYNKLERGTHNLI